MTFGVFTRGDITIEVLDINGDVIKTQNIAGQTPASPNSKILSHTIKN